MFQITDNLKKEPVPADYIKQVVLRGTGFVGGKKRVYDIMKSEFVRSERVKRIKNEYGTGGAGWPMEGYGLHGYDTFQAKGIRFQWRDEEGEKEGYANWNAVEEVISALVLTGEYYTPEPMSIEEEYTEEIDASDDVIDTDYKDISEDDDRDIAFDEANTEEETETLDEFAIPDEVDDMGIPDSKRASDEQKENAWYGMTPEELVKEDELVTFAEYGREFMDEDTYNAKLAEMLDEREGISEPADVINTELDISEGTKPVNFHMSPFFTQSAGMMTRYDWNIKALRTLKQIQSEHRPATHEEHEILSKYVGWGGLSQAFDADNENWTKEYSADPDVKNFTFTEYDGKIYFRRDSRMYEWEAGDKMEKRIRGLMKIRELIIKGNLLFSVRVRTCRKCGHVCLSERSNGQNRCHKQRQHSLIPVHLNLLITLPQTVRQIKKKGIPKRHTFNPDNYSILSPSPKLPVTLP